MNSFDGVTQYLWNKRIKRENAVKWLSTKEFTEPNDDKGKNRVTQRKADL